MQKSKFMNPVRSRDRNSLAAKISISYIIYSINTNNLQIKIIDRDLLLTG